MRAETDSEDARELGTGKKRKGKGGREKERKMGRSEISSRIGKTARVLFPISMDGGR